MPARTVKQRAAERDGRVLAAGIGAGGAVSRWTDHSAYDRARDMLRLGARHLSVSVSVVRHISATAGRAVTDGHRDHCR